MNINKRNRTELKSYFVKNAIPTESNFADLIDGALNQKDDGIVKLPGDPLSIEASGDATSLKKTINFYRSLSDANPDWTINLNPRSNPNDAATARLGFNISDGEGNSRLFIDRNTGNVGIGTTTPNDKLHVNGNMRTENGTLWLRAGADANHGVGWYGASKLFAGTNIDGPVVFGFAGGALATTSGGQKLTLSWNSSGNIGVGTPSPSEKLQVSAGKIQLDGNQQIKFTDADTTNNLKLQLWSGYGLGINGGTLFYAANGRHSWRDNNGTTERMALTTAADGGLTVMGTGNSSFAGNVGIGTTTISPGARLQVAGGAIMPAAGNTETAGIMFPKNPGGGGGDAAWIRYYAREGEKTTFEIGTTNDADDHIALMASGNVGIGTTTPEAKLEINATSTTHGGWLEAIRFSRTEHSAITHPGGGLLFGLHGDRNFYFADIKDGFKKYVMSINADTGNVGIGTTPTKRLHVEAGELRVRASHNDITPDIGAFYAQNLTQGIGIGYNRIEAIGSNAAQDILILPKGTGNVGIGTPSPGAKLEVGGDVKTNKGFATVANVAGVKIRIGSVNIPAVASGNRMDTLTHGENFSSKESYIVIAKVCEVHGSLGGAVFTTYECRPLNTTQFIIRWSHNWPSALTAVVYYVVIGT